MIINEIVLLFCSHNLIFAHLGREFVDVVVASGICINVSHSDW